MVLEPFALERWLLQECKYDIASAGITKLKLGEVVEDLDFNMLLNYGITKGADRIREEISTLYSNVDKNRILVTSGTAEANFLVLYRLLEKGDEFVTVFPTYMQCVGIARSLGADLRSCYLQEKDGYRLDIAELKGLVTKKTKIIFLVNPNNPTGAIISSKEMQAVCEIAEEVGAWVLCDGALRGLELAEEFSPTPVEFYEKGIATGSISKIGLTGLRIGWLIADEKLVEECWTYKDYTTLCHSGIGEFLATAALKMKNYNGYLKRAKNVIRSHLGILADWVEDNSGIVHWVPSRGGHTAFIGYDLDIDAEEFCRQLLEEEDVLVSPGDYFGTARHLRVRYSCDTDTLVNALDRFGTFLTRLPR